MVLGGLSAVVMNESFVVFFFEFEFDIGIIGGFQRFLDFFFIFFKNFDAAFVAVHIATAASQVVELVVHIMVTGDERILFEFDSVDTLENIDVGNKRHLNANKVGEMEQVAVVLFHPMQFGLNFLDFFVKCAVFISHVHKFC